MLAVFVTLLIALSIQLAIEVSAFSAGKPSSFRPSPERRSKKEYSVSNSGRPRSSPPSSRPIFDQKETTNQDRNKDKKEAKYESISDLTRIAEEERLQKVISRAGIASRRAAEKIITDGRVTVNGKLVTELGTKVHTRKDLILVDGKKISLPDVKSVLWVAVHKPRGCLTTMEDDKERESTIHSLVPRAKELRLLSVGRLDRDSTGLMILTNENGWIHPLTHPSFVHKRRYEVVAKGIPSEEAILVLKQGGFTLPEDTIPLSSSLINMIDSDKAQDLCVLDFTIEERTPRQLQKMLEYLKCEMLGLKRLEFGPVRLKGLRKGEWRELTQLEIEQLKASCVKSDTVPPIPQKRRSRFVLKARTPGTGYLSRGGGQLPESIDGRRRGGGLPLGGPSRGGSGTTTTASSRPSSSNSSNREEERREGMRPRNPRSSSPTSEAGNAVKWTPRR